MYTTCHSAELSIASSQQCANTWAVPCNLQQHFHDMAYAQWGHSAAKAQQRKFYTAIVYAAGAAGVSCLRARSQVLSEERWIVDPLSN
jgi:hypothetical protein